MLNRHITLCLQCIKAYLPRMVEVAKDFKGGNQTKLHISRNFRGSNKILQYFELNTGKLKDCSNNNRYDPKS